MEIKPSPYKRVDTEILDRLRAIVGRKYVLIDKEQISSFASDHTEDLRFDPEVVVKPANKEEVAAILRMCQKQNVPIVPAGARTGLSGGVLPIYGGISLGMERLNKIIEIDTRSLQARVQPAVITQVFSEAAEAHGLMYPVDPASRGSCFIGGNIAESSGGMRAVKYGTTRDYVLDLEVVLSSGEIIRTGARTLKNSTGYNLTQLLVGSEGTLGVITEATFKLVPLPSGRSLMWVPFADAEAACNAISAVFMAGITPSAIEFLEREAVDFGQEFLGEAHFNTEGIEAVLIVEVDGNHPEVLMLECEKIYEVMEKHGAGEILFAGDESEQERIWRLRRCIGEAVKSKYVYKEEDTVVPRAELARLWKFIKEKSVEYGFFCVCYGHAGDGNLHVNILKKGISDHDWEHKLPVAIREIFEYTVRLGGTLSGEHGIGLVQKGYMDIAFNSVELDLMRAIKQVFDPSNILNPGKIFPSLPESVES